MTDTFMYLPEVKLTFDEVIAVKKAMKWKLNPIEQDSIISMLEQQLTISEAFKRTKNSAANEREVFQKAQNYVGKLTKSFNEIEKMGLLTKISMPYKFFVMEKVPDAMVRNDRLPTIIESLKSLSEALSMCIDAIKLQAGKPVDTEHLFATISIIRFFKKHFPAIKISSTEESHFALFMFAVYTHVFKVEQFDVRSRIERAQTVDEEHGQTQPKTS